MAKPALIVIDVQNDYFPGGRWELRDMEAAADNASRLLAAARQAGDVVVHVRHEFPTADAPFFAPGSTGAQIHSKVQNQPGEEVVLKHQINAFRDTPLREILDRQGVEDVVICGAMSHMCVDAATRAASDLGYRCTVVHDACATRDMESAGSPCLLRRSMRPLWPRCNSATPRAFRPGNSWPRARSKPASATIFAKSCNTSRLSTPSRERRASFRARRRFCVAGAAACAMSISRLFLRLHSQGPRHASVFELLSFRCDCHPRCCHDA